MNRLKRYFILLIAVALTITLFGCGLIGADTSVPATNGSLDQDLPEWLTVDHRAQMEERPVEEPENNGLEPDADRAPIVNQPASPQPESPQPAPQPSGTPRWQQPGTMEYVTKLQLDQTVINYKLLNNRIVNFDETDPDGNILKALKKDRADSYERMSAIAASIGLSLEQVYGIKPPPTTSATPSSTWFNEWDHSPTGFNNQN